VDLNPQRDTSDFIDPYGVDLRRPLYPQVGKLGDRYFEWVHQPVRKATLSKLREWDQGRWPGSVRIFEQEWLEAMTHIPWQLVLSIWVPIVAGLAGLAKFRLGMSWDRLTGLGILGILVWTLVEYLLHRFGFHTPTSSPAGNKAHFLAHGIHHLDPFDRTRLLFPPLGALGIAGVIYLVFRLLMPLDVSLILMAGLLTGYLIYDFSHYISHHGKIMGPWFRFLHRYHKAHHHRDPDALYGVSSPLWDRVFRTGSRQF
jgi:dihydroceramide fatty acyl 2-hydroxylase